MTARLRRSRSISVSSLRKTVRTMLSRGGIAVLPRGDQREERAAQVRRARAGAELGDGPLCDDAPVADDADPRADRLRLVEQVGGEQDAFPAGGERLDGPL